MKSFHIVLIQLKFLKSELKMNLKVGDFSFIHESSDLNKLNRIPSKDQL